MHNDYKIDKLVYSLQKYEMFNILKKKKTIKKFTNNQITHSRMLSFATLLI